jgi:hypothetical protein
MAAMGSDKEHPPPAELWNFPSLNRKGNDPERVPPELAASHVDKEMPGLGHKMYPRKFPLAGPYKWWYAPGSPRVPAKLPGQGWEAREGEPAEYLERAKYRGEGRKALSRHPMWIFDGPNRVGARYVDDDTEAIYELLSIWHGREGCGCGQGCALEAVTVNPGRGKKNDTPEAKAHRATLERWAAKLKKADAKQAAIGEVLDGRGASAVSKLQKEGLPLLEDEPKLVVKAKPRRCVCDSTVGVALRERLNPRNLTTETALLGAECGTKGGWKEKKILGRVEGETGLDAPTGRDWQDAQQDALGMSHDEQKELNEERGHDL